MNLISVESAHGNAPVLEGSLLTLVCLARGSDRLQMRWFKDGKTFNLTMTHRNAWQLRVPNERKQISVLNVDGVATYDIGEDDLRVLQ